MATLPYTFSPSCYLPTPFYLDGAPVARHGGDDSWGGAAVPGAPGAPGRTAPRAPGAPERPAPLGAPGAPGRPAPLGEPGAPSRPATLGAPGAPRRPAPLGAPGAPIRPASGRGGSAEPPHPEHPLLDHHGRSFWVHWFAASRQRTFYNDKKNLLRLILQYSSLLVW